MFFDGSWRRKIANLPIRKCKLHIPKKLVEYDQEQTLEGADLLAEIDHVIKIRIDHASKLLHSGLNYVFLCLTLNRGGNTHLVRIGAEGIRLFSQNLIITFLRSFVRFLAIIFSIQFLRTNIAELQFCQAYSARSDRTCVTSLLIRILTFHVNSQSYLQALSMYCIYASAKMQRAQSITARKLQETAFAISTSRFRSCQGRKTVRINAVWLVTHVFKEWEEISDHRFSSIALSVQTSFNRYFWHFHSHPDT